MESSLSKGGVAMNRKTIKISEKRQITIPQKYYEKLGLNFEIKALPSTFVVELPRITLNAIKSPDEDVFLIINFIEKNGSITRKDAENLIQKEKTTTATILNKLVENKVLVKVGNGPSTRYEKY